jgi:hypothetical protein
MGGTLHDGTYVMTSATYYGDGSGCPAAEVDHTTWLICGTSWQSAQDSTPTGGQTTTLNLDATVTQSGTQVTLDITCGYPTQTPFTFGYDANGTTLRLYVADGTTTASGRVDTFTKK